MAKSLTHLRAAILVGFIGLGGCADRNITDPAFLGNETLALASARKPERAPINETYSFALDCGSFTGLAEGSITGHETVFFDREGNPSRLQAHLRYRATITNTATGKTLKDDSSYSFKVDFVTGVQEVNGRVYDVKDRETGFRIKDVGRLVFDAAGNITFEAGRHDVKFEDATPLYCRALA